MKQLSLQLNDIIKSYRKLILTLPDDKLAVKLPGKWSKKEELGHLIDSAHSNLRRFVVSRYVTQPNIIYDQNFWVKASGYNEWPIEPLTDLWFLLNGQICSVWQLMTDDEAKMLCNTGHGTTELHSLHWLGEDYIKHLLHHMHHLLDLEPVSY